MGRVKLEVVMTTAPSNRQSPVESFVCPDSLDECKQLIIQFSEERASIDWQLSKSISDEKEGIKKPDWDWIRKATMAHRIKGLQIMKLNNKIAELNKASVLSRDSEVAEAFLSCAIRMLDPEVRGDIWDAVIVNYPELKHRVTAV